MKELDKIDVGSYFVDKTQGFSKEPPAHVWNNIEVEISNKSFYSILLESLLRYWANVALFVSTTALLGSIYIYDTGSAPVTEIPVDVKSNLEVVNADKNEASKVDISNTKTAELQVITEEDIHEADVEIIEENGVTEVTATITKESEDVVDDNIKLDVSLDDENLSNIDPVDNISEEIRIESDDNEIIKTKANRIYNFNISKYQNIKEIKILDMKGVVIKQIQPEHTQYEFLPIKLGNIPVGTYYFHIKTAENKVFTEEIAID